MAEEIYRRISQSLEFIILKGADVIDYEGETIPKSHQVFPDRFLQSNPETDVILLDYTVGTGKSISAIMPIVRLMSMIRELSKISNISGILHNVPKPYVVGTWATIQAFEFELMKPVFGIITQEEINTIDKLVDEEKWSYKRRLIQRIRNEVNMMTYQKFFNHFFKGSINLPDKSDAAIVQAIHDGKIYLNIDVIGELNNSILVIDEFQNLYSASGMNTYGTCVEYIRQHKNIEGLTIIGLSGTFLNSVLTELVYLYNIIRPKGHPRFEIAAYVTKEQVNPSHVIVRLQKGVEEKLLKFSEGKIASYSKVQSKDFPTVEMEGELIKTPDVKFKWFKIVRCYASPLQWKHYQESKVAESEETEEKPITGELVPESEVEDEGQVHMDVYIPPQEEWIKHGIENVPGKPGTYRGKFFEMPNLAKYGTVPARFISAIQKLFKEGKREKIAGYHRRIRRMGVYQYVEILRANHMISADEQPQNDTVCIECGKARDEHKRDTKHKYVAARYVTLIGDYSPAARSKILDLWNSPTNTTGENAIVIIISSIAELGLILKDTNHLYMLGYVPHMSRFRQIQGRFARFGSHSQSPPNRRWLKTYVLVFSPPESKKDELTSAELLYYTKESNDAEITNMWQKIRARSINCAIHASENPNRGYECKYNFPFPKAPSTKNYKILYSMLEIATVVESVKHMTTKISPVWRIGDIYRALKTNKYLRLPWLTQYISDSSIVDSLWNMNEKGIISIISMSGKQKVELTPFNIKGDDLIILRRAKKENTSLVYNLFKVVTPSFNLTSIPLTEGTFEITAELKKFNETKGFKNKIDIMNILVVYDKIVDILKKDFTEKGVFFKLLSSIDSIVYKGDDKSHITFAENRTVNKNPTPVGFIIGLYAHMYNGSAWTSQELPVSEVKVQEEWDYAGIFSTGSEMASGKWMTRFRLRPRLRKSADQRALRLGMGCRSIDRDILAGMYKNIVPGKIPEQKEEMCFNIRQALLQRQIKSKVRVIYTYFEAPKYAFG